MSLFSEVEGPFETPALTDLGKLKLYFFDASETFSLEFITDLGEEKLNVLDNGDFDELTSAEIKLGFSFDFFTVSLSVNDFSTHFIFEGDSVESSLIPRFKGLLSLLFLSRTSGGIGLTGGSDFLTSILEESLVLIGAGVDVKLNAGNLLTCNGGTVERGSGTTGIGAVRSGAGLLRPESVTLDFILKLDLAVLLVALALLLISVTSEVLEVFSGTTKTKSVSDA